MRSVFILFSIIYFPAFGAIEDSIRSEQREEGLFVIHEVEEQETIYSIAKRYGSSIQSIKKFNDLDANRIEIGQILSVLVEAENSEIQIENTEGEVHIVKAGETLYSISKLYDIRLKVLRKLNDLSNNDISLGQTLRLTKRSEKGPVETQAPVEVTTEAADTTPASEENGSLEIPEGFEKYLVQTGETLASIARKIGVRISSLKEWNNLSSDYLSIGQELLLPSPESSEANTVADSADLDTRITDEGFEKNYEEGIAAVIEDINTSKYLALHRSLPIGTELEVRNLMNNRVVHVKVVGKLPDTGINKNVMLRLSKSAFDKLGILDPKSRVEASHFKE